LVVGGQRAWEARRSRESRCGKGDEHGYQTDGNVGISEHRPVTKLGFFLCLSAKFWLRRMRRLQLKSIVDWSIFSREAYTGVERMETILKSEPRKLANFILANAGQL